MLSQILQGWALTGHGLGWTKRGTWRCRGSNPGPFACKANALPLSYIPFPYWAGGGIWPELENIFRLCGGPKSTERRAFTPTNSPWGTWWHLDGIVYPVLLSRGTVIHWKTFMLSGSVAERSKALVLGTSLLGGVGSNPTAAKFCSPCYTYRGRTVPKHTWERRGTYKVYQKRNLNDHTRIDNPKWNMGWKRNCVAWEFLCDVINTF